jgi:hypothetical protein
MQNWWHSLWDTPEGLARFFYGTQWAIAIFGILTAVAIVLSIVISRRRDDFQGQQISEAQQESTRIRDALNQSNQKLSELEKKTAPRILTEDQREKLNAFLATQKGYPVTLSANLGDQEGIKYAQQIKGILEKNGWKVDGPDEVVFDPPQVGTEIVITDERQTPIAALIVLRGFEKAGISVRGGANTQVPIGTVDIRVGSKP